jgi:hypothetical protein
MVDLDARIDAPAGLMREHLTSMRAYLFGVTPDEYRMTLKMAMATLPQIGSPELKSRFDNLLVGRS